MRGCFGFCKRRRPHEEVASSSDEREEFLQSAWRTPGVTSTRRATSRAVVLSGDEAFDKSEAASMYDDEDYLDLYTKHFEPDANIILPRVFHEWRCAAIDSDEQLLWSSRMVRMVVEDLEEDVYADVQTASRRGVPDGLKPWVLRRAQNTGSFLRARSRYVAQTYQSVFGNKAPDFADGVVPTFSRGFRGTEEELHGEAESEEEPAWDIAPPPEPLLHKGYGSRPSILRSASWTDFRDILQVSSTRRGSHEIGSPLSQPSFAAVPTDDLQFPSYQNDSPKSRLVEGLPSPPRIRPPPLVATKSEPAFSLNGVTPLCSILTPQGQYLTKKILWTINYMFPHLDFAPILAPLTCVLLCYLTEDECLVLLLRTLERSNDLLKSGANRVFLTFRRSEFVRYIHVALAFCRKQLPDLTHHLQKIGVDLAAWIARAVQDGFSKLLPFDFLLRIYIPFIFEGSKVFLRYCLALLKLNETALLNCDSADEANLLLLFREYRRPDGKNPQALNDLTKLAFRFQIRAVKEPLSKYSSHEVPTPYLTRTKIQKYYRPRLGEETSSVINDGNWEMLWRWLPANCRILDPELVFSSNRDGLSLKALNRVIWNDAERPMIFLIKTADDDVIGGFATFGFRPDADEWSRSMDLSGCFVFHLRPHMACYHWSGAVSKIMQYDKESLCFGWNPPAVMLESDLLRGHSAECPAFDSPRLVRNSFGDFEVVTFEVWFLA